MNSENIVELKRLCVVAEKACNAPVGTQQFELSFVKVLEFIKAHNESTAEFKDFFVQMLNNESLGPWELIAFCMHDLRWPLILDEAQMKLTKSDDHRVQRIMSNVIDAYSESWGDLDIYSYYQNPTSRED